MFDNDPNDSGEFNSTYHLSCVPKKITKNVIDVDIHGKEFRSESHCVIAIPQESTEFYRFMTSFKEAIDLKPDLDDVCEFAAFIGGPVNSPARVAALKPNEDCGEYHIFIMSADAEYALLQKLDQESETSSIEIRILPSGNEEEYGI